MAWLTKNKHNEDEEHDEYNEDNDDNDREHPDGVITEICHIWDMITFMS